MISTYYINYFTYVLSDISGRNMPPEYQHPSPTHGDDIPEAEGTAQSGVTRQRAIAHVRPISISSMINQVSQTRNISAALQDFDRHYMPSEESTLFTARSCAPVRREDLQRKAENISRSTCEVYAFLTSGTKSHAEAKQLLEIITNVSSCFKCIKLVECNNGFNFFNIFKLIILIFQLSFRPMDIAERTFETMHRHVMEAMLPGCKVLKFNFHEGDPV